MPTPWVDVEKTKASLSAFFQENSKSINKFGTTVNQTFEAFVFATVVEWYKENGWTVEIVHPEEWKRKEARATKKPGLRLKFNTRGRPSGYSYARAIKAEKEVEIRHQLRVATAHYRPGDRPRANICLDVAVIEPNDCDAMTSDDHVESPTLVTFAEAKHMSAFAELVANFVGLVHELQPTRLSRVRSKKRPQPPSTHPAPFLYVSGIVYPTAQGIIRTIKRRRYDIDVYDQTSALVEGLQLELMPARKKKVTTTKNAKATPRLRLRRRRTTDEK